MRKINLFLIIFGFLHLLAFKGFSQSSVCLNDTIYLELPAFRGNIQWQESTDSLNWTDISGANYQPFAFPAVETKFYRAVITEGSCYPIYSDVRKIIVLGLPQNVSATATPNPVCEGSSLVLSGSGLGATTWSWSGPNGFTSTVQNPEISSVTTAASGIYTLTASNACGSATAVNTSAVTVNNIPTGASAAATPNPICAGQTLSLTGSATGATSWSWAGPNSYTSSSQNPSISSVTTAAAGTYTLTASNSCGSATAVNTASVTVNITPSVPTAATHTPSETQIVWNWNTVAGATGYKWSTTNNYATATNMGTSTTKTETSLTCNTAYTRYVWAYNDCGNSAVLTLTEITSACPIANCGIITDARDGNIYQTVLIGSQCWMAENLAYLPTVHSNTEFETQGNNSQPGYGVYGYDGSDVPTAKTEANYSTYGVLYNWWAAMQGESTCNGSGPPPNDSCLTPVKGICPAGWHLPSHYEWTTLERAVCSSGSCTTDFPYDVSTTGERGTDEGSKLAGNAGLWTNGTLDSHASFGTSGFSGLPGGSRSTNGAYYNIANYAYWWSSTEYSAAGAWTRVLAYGGSSVFRTNPSKEYGFSVRCVRDL